MADKNVTIRFKADTASLEAGSRRAAVAMGGVAKASDKTKGSTDKSTKALKKFEDQTGEADSVLQGLAGALDQVSPELGNLARVAGDASGGLEAVARAGPVAGVALGAVAVVGLAVATAFASAQAEMEAATRTQEAAAASAARTVTVYRELDAILGVTVSDTEAQARAVADLINEEAANRAEIQAQISGMENFADRSSDVLIGLKAANAVFGEFTGKDEELAQLNTRLAESEARLAGIKREAQDAVNAVDLLAPGEFETAGRVDFPKAGGGGRRASAGPSPKDVAAARSLAEAERARAALLPDILQATEGLSDAEIRRRIELERIGEALQLNAITSEEATALQLQTEEEFAAVQLANIAEREAAREKAHDNAIARSEAEVEASEAEAEAAKAAAFESLAAAEQAAEGIMDLSDTIIDAKIANLDLETAEGKARATELAEMQKKVAVTGAIVSAAAGLVKSVEVLGPPVPPNVAGILGFAAAGAIGAAGIIAASMVPLPTFATGGIVPNFADHGLVAASPGEGVITEAGVNSIGGPAAVDAINAGRGGSGGGGAVVNVYGHKVYDDFVADNIAKGGPLQEAVWGRNGRPGHSRRLRT